MNYLLELTLSFFVAVLASSKIAYASDPDILSDFILTTNSSVDGAFFTHTGLRGIFDEPPKTFKVSKATVAEFPALNGQGVSFTVFQYPPGAVNPLHTHPRSAELFFVVEGSLCIGAVSTNNVHFNTTLQRGDMFIFPKGLVHYQFNKNPKEPATAISAFGSANAGTVSLPTTVFTAGIDEVILSKAFKTDIATIQKIKAGLTPKA